MKLHFLGANRQVTGSRYCLEISGRRILIDCGMFQEREFEHRNWDNCPLEASSIDLVIITHAHIDHVGLLPRLVRQGFKGRIVATLPTVDLTEIMLKDAAHIQMEDVKYKQKRHKKQGHVSPHPYEPLYDDQDAIAAVRLLDGVPYNTPIDLLEGVSVIFQEAGHILGSATLRLSVRTSTGETRQLVFSGDIGQWGKPLIRDPQPVEVADYLIMESTYGDRNHADAGDVETQLHDICAATLKRGGKVIIPTFAVERAQELMYHLSGLVHARRLPDVPIFLDSPMAVDVTEIFRNHRDAYDEATWQRISSGIPPLRFPGLHMVRTTEESKSINRVDGPAIIMSTSGMCTAGRIKHHLKNNISNPLNTLLFVGYQGQGTLGRLILDGKPFVRIHGQEHSVKANVARIFGFSGHADRDALLRWATAIHRQPRRTFLTHGEEPSSQSLAKALRKSQWDVDVPAYCSAVDLE